MNNTTEQAQQMQDRVKELATKHPTTAEPNLDLAEFL